MTPPRGILPNQQPSIVEQNAGRDRTVRPPRKDPRLLKLDELCFDANGNLCQGLGNGQYRTIGLAKGTSSDTSASDAQITANDALKLAHPQLHEILSTDDHAFTGTATGTRSDGLIVDKGIVTALGTASSTPEASLWERDGDGMLQVSGLIDGHTGLWAYDYLNGGVQETAGDGLPDTYWERDVDGMLVQKAVA